MCLLVLGSVASAVWATEQSGSKPGLQVTEYGPNIVLTSSSSGYASKSAAAADTFCIYGGPGSLKGKFQLANGVQPDLQGWTSHDPSDQGTFWQPSTFNSPTGTQAMWAGRTLAQEPGWLTSPGYGNYWNAILAYTKAANVPGTGQTLGLSFVANVDSEDGYDPLVIEYDKGGVWTEVYSISGNHALDVPAVDALDAPITYAGGDYSTDGKIKIRFRAISNLSIGDEDGFLDTNGFAQLDNIVVTDNSSGSAVTDTEDFNSAGPYKWVNEVSVFAGDFGKIFAKVTDPDPCREDITPILGFIDNTGIPNNPGYVVTGTEVGSTSPNWNYGIQGGWVLNFNGGVSNGLLPLNNEWWSPEIVWDLPGTADDGAQVSGAYIRMSVFQHLPLGNGLLWAWQVRGKRTSDGVWEAWRDRDFVYYTSSFAWANAAPIVSDLLPVDKTHVQFRLTIRDIAYIFGLPGNDATAAPFYDNAAFVKYKIAGPSYATRQLDLFSDTFAGSGTNDLSTAAGREALACRIDMSRTIVPASNPSIRSGDSAIVDIKSLIPGVAITNPLTKIRMHYSLNMNPIFEIGIRGNTSIGTVTAGTGQYGWAQCEGTVQAALALNSAGVPKPERYAFDLPDSNFMFPGDKLEYYIEAFDDAGNTTTFPSVLTGYDDTSAQYNRQFTVNALPSYSNTAGDHPTLLYWNDVGHDRGIDNEWTTAFAQQGLVEGVHVDVATFGGESSQVDNGLGSSSPNGRGHGATPAQMSGYDCVLYDAFLFSAGLLSDGSDNSVNDKSNDVALLTTWFGAEADRFIAHFGDNLCNYMGTGSAAQQTYLSTIMGVKLNDTDVRNEIGGQTAPHILPTGSVSAFTGDFVAYGGCLGINDFDSIVPLPASGAVAGHGYEIVAAPGTTYPVTDPGSAASVVWDRLVNINTVDYRKVSVTFPYSWHYVYNATKAGITAQSTLTGEILALFGGHSTGGATDAPSGRSFRLHASYPNPFNPKTNLSFTLGRAGDGAVKIYNVRGELVRTLSVGTFKAGLNTLPWNGTDNAGATVASGVYVVKYSIDGFNMNQKIVMVK
jgi:hypothetical protein